ncbi:tetratricopeptide repeat protein [Spirillospora sp. NPDC029432]|uniref:nSTAND1 domain-containing NTPase n=1 Tax=Spirillospora sp. NPDC029432 TaxID=3154599 RepID=UPI0034554B0D
MITNSVAEGTSPFAGDRPFGRGDDHLFHGRRRESEDVVRLWRDNRLTVLHGGAGAGKTSLVCAGAMPLLDSAGERVLRPGRIWRRNAVPAAAFPEQNLFTFALLSSWYPDEPAPGVAGRTVLGFLRRQGGRGGRGLPVRTFAAIDDAELLVRDPVAHREQRRRFIGQLAEAMAAEPNLHLLLAVREEYLDEVRALAARLAEGRSACHPLAALDRDAASEAVRGPFERTGRRVERRTADSLADELRTVRTPPHGGVRRIPAVSPVLLQLVCDRLWADLPAESGADPDEPGMDAVRAWQQPRPEDGVVGEVGGVGEDGSRDPGADDAGGWSGPDGEAGRAGPVREPEAESEAGGGRSFAAGVDRVLAEYCGQALATVASDHRMVPRELVSWFRAAFGDPAGGGVPRSDPGVPDAVLRALEDAHLIRVHRRAGERRYELHHPRLLPVIGMLADRPGPARRREPAERLRAAERALCEGAAELAWHHAKVVVRTQGKNDPRVLARAHRLLGNIAYEYDRRETAAECYRAAARLFEVVQDTRAVGLLLAAAARIVMEDGAAGAVSELHAAANRSPHDLVVQTALGRALWQAGQPGAALAVLDAVLQRDGDMPEALRTRGEILAARADG